MRVEVIDMEQTKNEAKKYILKKIPLVSKVFQFNSVIGDIKLEYIEFKVLIYEVISKKKNNKIFGRLKYLDYICAIKSSKTFRQCAYETDTTLN